LAHLPTPLHALPNLSREIGNITISVKRDDCTGLAMGGNKARQLEFYLGEARHAGADCVLITGAVQSNYVRATAAAARQIGMDCHVQLEERVPDVDAIYRRSGNVLLNRLLGATIHSYPEGEDETGADRQLETIAAQLRLEGKQPYVIHLGAAHPPRGALGYVDAAAEVLSQLSEQSVHVDDVVIPSGSSHTHTGLLFGLRALGSSIRVTGICVRRDAELQRDRVADCAAKLAGLVGIANVVSDEDIRVYDGSLAPGYGKASDSVWRAITTTAQTEGLLLDPVYSGKSMAGLLALAANGYFTPSASVLFVHTGGVPALFAYESAFTEFMSRSISP
jgi:D-cysteine desulfhydrase/L-cysteate sulfo-lyase